ncbi:MAG: DUF4239 domain-containing protein [Planctomycetota bacterium]
MDFFSSFSAVVGIAMALAMYGAMICLQVYGRRRSMRRVLRDPDGHGSGLGAVEGPIYGMFGLLLAFTFAGATQRFQDRRAMILDEAKAVSTAYSVFDLLPEPVRDDAHKRLGIYLDQHIEVFGKVSDPAAFQREYAQLGVAGDELWNVVTAELRTDRSRSYSNSILPPLTDVFDIATARRATLGSHPPMVIYLLLHALALVCAFLAGFASGPARHPSWVHFHVLAAAIAATIYVTLDLEYPRLGLIRVDAADSLLRELRAAIK